jgi:transformation/transcription domain-associated protein
LNEYRPLAYSMLADLVHHIRSDLSPTQLYRTVYIYSRNLHDATLAPSIQTMCGKLLLNLIDCIIKIPNKKEGRDLLMRILDAFASKFAALNIQFKSCLKQYIKKNKNHKRVIESGPGVSGKDDVEMEDAKSDDFDFDAARSIHTASFTLDPQQDGIKDGRFLFKNLAIGLKPLFIGLRHCNPAPTSDTNPQTYSQFARGFSQEDIHILLRLFREGIMCFEYYNIDYYGANGSPPNENINPEDTGENTIGSNELSLKIGTQVSSEKEILEMFAIVFTLLDPAVFQEIFVSQMSFFFDRMLINTSLAHIAQYFLANDISSQGFASILFSFLVDRIDRLGDEDMLYSAVMLHLFRLAFMAVNLFPDANESTLQPYLGNLVTSCFKLSAKAKVPANYFLLLRALFKSIGGGRFELLYKEVSPLLQVLLENLNSLLTLAHRTEMRNLFVELCLAVPVRLSTLLPYLPYLMRPLVIALQADQELVTQGLRTMELCNDNLNPEFLDQIMAPVMKELMDALWSHLRPLPYSQQHSHIAMRILGKLGGRNRRMLNSPPSLDFEKQIESGVSVEIVFDPNSTPQTLPLDKCLEVACKTLEKRDIDVFYKKQAYEFLKANIIQLLELDEGPDTLAQSLYQRVKEHLLQSEVVATAADTKATDDTNKNESDKAEKTDQSLVNDMDIDKPTVSETSRKFAEGGSTVVGDALNESGLKPKRLAGNGYTKYLSKRVAQEDSLRTMLVAIIKASTLTELPVDAWPFFENICRHFMLLHIGEAIEAKENGNKILSDMMDERLSVQSLNTTILVDAIVKVISSENPKLRARAEESLQLCFDTAVKVLGSKEYVWQLPIFRVFASQFGSCCYKQEWFNKRGGCLGISIISSQLDMGTKWMREHELDFIRSLLFVLKDASPEMSNVNTVEATQTLSHVLKVCNRPEDDESPEAQQKFQNLIALLLSELSNSNSAVRETIQSSFQLLADLTGNEVTELLAPVRERLVAPIFAKPLRALPFAMQIGHIDAITYCLTLRPPFLEFNDELIRLLHEALALADAEDQALVSRSAQYKNATSLMNLRIVCIKLLSAAMACSDFSNQRQTHTRARIIQVFFKSLYSKAPEVVEAAHRGLKQVLAQQHKLPKELLQQGLRPILTTLSNHKTLSIAGLEGLARLLELLTNYFKVEIGKKLLDHLKQWAEPKVLQEAAGRNLSENHEVKIIVAILNIFHLLPAAAHIFLDDLVSVVLEMEDHLRRSISSPFRPNLIKYLNRYPVETVAYFYDRLDQPRHSRLFIDILNTENASQLRDEVAKAPKNLIEKTFGIPDNANLHYQGVLIVREVVAYDTNWLINQPELLESLLALWRSPTRFEVMKKDDEQGLQMTHESLYLSQIFISYLRVNPDNIDVTFEVASLFAQESVMDLSYLREFFLKEVALQYPSQRKRLIMEKFLQQFNDSSISSFSRMMTLRHVINPALLVAITRKSNAAADVLDSKVMEQLDSKIWAQLGSDASEENQYAEDSLRIELLQLTAMIVQYAPLLLTDIRKDIIKFGWHYLRLEDATCKQAAYVLIARFITAFETPSKIVIQIYAALLRAHLSEARALVKQGLDIIAPVLPKRVPHSSNERVPTWVRLTRRVVVEDTHSISQMVNVYQLLVRQPDLFYDYREHFLPQIVNALPKLGLLQNATPENKLLTVELTELLLKWEQTRLKNQPKKANDTVPLSPSGKRLAEVLPDTPKKKNKTEASDGEIKSTSSPSGVATTDSPNATGHKEYVPSLTLRENTIGYLVRLACSVYNPSDVIQRRLVQRVLELIKRFLDTSIWPDVHVKFAHLERTLTVKEMSELLVSSVCSALEILNIDLANKPSEWFIVNMSQLFRLLENSIKSDNVRIHTALQPVLSSIFRAINQTTNAENREEPQHPDVAAFVSLVDSTITDGMASMNNIYAVLKLLQASSTSRSEQLDPFVPGIVKMLQKLTKEHITSTHITSSTGYDSQVNLLILGLNLLKRRISHLGDQRRWFLTCLIQLIEKSPDVQLLHAILDMLAEWTLDKTETFPTIKEKAGLLVKMMSLESRNNVRLTEDFLDLVIKIYSNPSFARSELTVRLEQAFLLGTRNENPQIRSQFMRVFDRSISRTLYTRLNYILGVQNWESLSGTFWIHQALDMLFGGVKINPQATMAHTLKIKSIKSIGIQDEPTEMDVPNELNDVVQKHQLFLKELQGSDINNSISSARYLQYLDDETAFKLWVDLFPMCWSALSSTEKHDMTKVIIHLLAKEHHNKQAELRPNVIQALLTGIAKINSGIRLPPHLVKYLGQTHNAWHTAIEILQQTAANESITDSSKDDLNNHERTLDTLSDLYASLNEDDMFYGLWRRRSTYTETNVAVSCEQIGLWSQAQTMYENAQIKARSGVSPFSESEYMLWEDHWISCSQKLQQWDILSDLAKHDNNTSLALDCAWRLSDWAADREPLEQAVAQLSDTPTPRLKAMEGFLALIKSQTTDDRLADFTRICEEGVQLSLQKWYSLPHIVSRSHLPLLQIFQQYLELHEASQIFVSLVSTNVQNLEQRSTELRSILATWRDRLPNTWDDINIWSDTIAWRQHVFNAINRTYLPLIPMLPMNQPNVPGANSFAYRGYHESAWIINRFAHVARKHQLNDVCINYLTKIYTLPNIEIQEAFLKLREQAKCYYQNPSELTAGLDVITNTNLNYFSLPQKAEFYTLKGQFLAKLNHYNEANEAFVNAVQIDLSLPRAWAEWGRYNDNRFKESPHDLSWANNAVSCYLQAAGIYKNAKARKYLLRVLWLLSLDDTNGTISRAFEGYKGEWPVWYWVTFIPQLLMALQQREAKHARNILIRIAKQFPQVLDMKDILMIYND